MGTQLKNLEMAAKIAKLESEKIDFALLVGGLANLQEWAKKEVHLNALGKQSMCSKWREKGAKMVSDSSMAQTDHALPPSPLAGVLAHEQDAPQE